MNVYFDWPDLTQEHRDALIHTLKRGGAVRIDCTVTGTTIWWGPEAVCKKDPRYQGEAIYTLSELKALEGHTPEMIKALNQFKLAFDAHVEKVKRNDDGL